MHSVDDETRGRVATHGPFVGQPVHIRALFPPTAAAQSHTRKIANFFFYVFLLRYLHMIAGF